MKKIITIEEEGYYFQFNNLTEIEKEVLERWILGGKIKLMKNVECPNRYKEVKINIVELEEYPTIEKEIE
ncbi:MAG: hypothetical protein JRJ00_00175 [Deltaproteobacteria bacterium]|nr:hypothetical protein [Deltaproteobacteria bacterium]